MLFSQYLFPQLIYFTLRCTYLFMHYFAKCKEYTNKYRNQYVDESF